MLFPKVSVDAVLQFVLLGLLALLLRIHEDSRKVVCPEQVFFPPDIRHSFTRRGELDRFELI